jgi:hypothetical protein
MKLFTQISTISTLLLALAVPGSVQAQELFRGAVGVYSGGSFFSEFTDEDDTGRSLSLEPGFVVGMQGEYWFNPRIAVRMNGAYTERPFELEQEEGFGGFDDNALFDGTFGDVNTYLADAGVLYRILSPKGSSRFAPFVHAGAGVVHYNPAGDERSIPEARVRFDEETRFAAVGGIGVDIVPNTPTKSFGAFIRMELVDHYVFDSPAERLALGLESDDEEFGGVHNLRLNLGMNVIFGIEPMPR